MKSVQRTLLLAALHTALLSAAALPQTNGAVLARVGDPLPGGPGTITGFQQTRVNNAGSWAAIIETSGPSDEHLVVNGIEVVAVGDVLPLAMPAAVVDIVDFDLDNAGNITSILDLTDGRRILARNGEPVLAAGELVFGFRLRQFSKVNSVAPGQVILRCEFELSPLVLKALLTLEFSNSDQLVDATLIASAGDVLPGQTSSLFSFGLGDNQLSYRGSDGIWCGRLLPGASPGEHVTYLDGATLLVQGGGPSPVHGRTFADVPLTGVAFSSSGAWALRALLDPSNTSNDEVLIVDGTVYAREGAPLGAFPGAPTVEGIGARNVFIANDARPIFLVDTDVNPAVDRAVLRGGSIVLREGSALASGDIVTALDDLPFALHASDSGAFVLVKAQLNGGTRGLIYTEETLGEPYCAAENNSTGAPSVTAASGSSLTALNALFLTTCCLPTGSFAYYISSADAGNTLFPGGSAGRLCLGGSIGRHIDGVGAVGPDGVFEYQIDLTSMPTSPNVAVLAGDTWHHQLWHRDVGSTSNFSAPIRIIYR